MSQSGVKQFVFPLDSIHNAIWDARVTKDGTLYFALATELTTAGYVRLYKYDFETNEAIECFKAEDVIMPSDKAIRASKFHTSIYEMNDGRLIMTTHTTDRSPLHPSWMPFQYYHHIWEDYAGSNIIIYDPKTGKAENLGIPVPHESIYGAAYDEKHNALFFTGMFRGHTYRYDLNARRLIDFGQTAENFAWRLLKDKNGDILGASRSGYMYKIDVNTLKIRDLNYRLPVRSYPEYTGGDFKCLSNGSIGPDGRLYMLAYYGRHIVPYDSVNALRLKFLYRCVKFIRKAAERRSHNSHAALLKKLGYLGVKRLVPRAAFGGNVVVKLYVKRKKTDLHNPFSFSIILR